MLAWRINPAHVLLRKSILWRGGWTRNLATSWALRQKQPATPGQDPSNSNETSEIQLDGLVLGCYAGTTPSLEQFSASTYAVNDALNHSLFEQAVASGFRGRRGDVSLFYPVGNSSGANETSVGEERKSDDSILPLIPSRIALVGLGTRKCSPASAESPDHSCIPDAFSRCETARVATAVGVRALRGTGATRIGIERELAGNSSTPEVDHAIAEGAGLAQYTFDHLKSSNRASPAPTTPARVVLVDRKLKPVLKESSSAFSQGEVYSQAQNLARYLTESPGNLMTPRIFAEAATRELADVRNVTLHVRDEAWVLSKGMHAFHAVAKGSGEPLQYLEIHYQGRKSSGTRSDNEEVPVDIALVGKGVTFDSGGISIKPSANMGMMKGDMGGAAAVLSAVHGIARLKEPVNVVALIPLCENMPSGKATKPGDVVRALNGLTIEIDNTGIWFTLVALVVAR
jgi:aminopeptidase